MIYRLSIQTRLLAAGCLTLAALLAGCAAEVTPTAQAATQPADRPAEAVPAAADSGIAVVDAPALEPPASLPAADLLVAAVDKPADKPAAKAAPQVPVRPVGTAPPAGAVKPAAPTAVPVPVAELPPSALLAVGAGAFEFASDEAGRTIGEYFALPRPLGDPQAETPELDAPWPKSADRLPRDLIPTADEASVHVIPLEQVVTVPLWPVLDLPPLGVEQVITLPERVAMPLAPKTLLAGYDPKQLGDLPLLGRMDEGVTALTDDPTTGAMLQALLAPLEGLRSTGIPFVATPPLEPGAAGPDLASRPALPDSDPPARSTAPPPAPILP